MKLMLKVGVLAIFSAGALISVDAMLEQQSQYCFEFPVVVVSAIDRSFPDATCNQERFPASDCLKAPVMAKIEVIDHADGSPNCYGTPSTAQYKAKTNYRGQTSLFFPKHQINVKFKNAINFLGFPEDKAFILNGPYLDCTLMRNHLAHWLYRNTGRYSPRTRHVAMFFRSDPTQKNPEYYGIYLLLEKLSYGPNRVNLARLDTSCSEYELNGGWAWQNDPPSFGSYSPNMITDQYQNEFGMGERPILAYPNGDALSQKMRDYFVNTTTGFLPQLYRYLWNNMTNPDALESHVDIGSFADYILHTEMSLNVDAYRRSTFFFKDRNQPINAGPVWDLNLAYGNGARRNFQDWIFPQYTFWKRLLCNYKLTSLLIQRWKTLRSEGGPWSDMSITQFLDESAAPVLQQLKHCQSDWRSNAPKCVSVSPKCNLTYVEQLDNLKAAVINRSKWMDAHITQLYKKLDAGVCSGVGTLPKYNCGPDGNDDGCLNNPEKYYKAVKFPPIRAPFRGPQCGGGHHNLSGHISEHYPVSNYEKPSEDYCWKSAGIYVYPEQKGVREKTLTRFCSGYGTCPEGPRAKCKCKEGILLEKLSCKRIDAQDTAVHRSNLVAPTTNIGRFPIKNILFVLAVGFFMAFVSVISLKKMQVHKKSSETLNTYRPVQYGSVEHIHVSSTHRRYT